ncbi:hypothetical protein AWM68_19855 [Fictibacillus phosphorivorans]|uniref:DUF2612 domain-containing protein n=1 Tax=Fictibacillus phosphorivorans TaxID=1221500 RepID=A0A163RKC2_9BACL|nr:hypothetical protein [Fictibacillus phosphorivorans]KZE66998.1 hypothetical protein AWM68_19855 [Fictibacillus phosphorivorans]
MSVYTDIIRKLPDLFTKKSDSNVGKMVLLLSEQIDTLNVTFSKIESWRDINLAEGSTLDMIGENSGQRRGQATDEIMRVLIKARIARNSSDGTFNSVIYALARSINADPTKIKIRALYEENDPAAVVIEGVPLAELNKVGMTAVQFGYIAQKVVAAGIRVAAVDLRGTFGFSSQNNVLETNTETGFAPLDQSRGGTLGATFEPDQTLQLPI